MCWDAEYCRGEFAQPRAVLANGKRIGHFSSPKSAHVMRSDYQIKCNKYMHIIKLDTRYQFKCATKLLKYMTLDSCI